MSMRSKTNEVKLSDSLGELVNHKRIKPKLQEVGINKVWKEIMGEVVDRYTSSIKVSANKLILSITSGALKHELAYNKSQLIKKVNDKMGDDYINDIIIR